ncbi:leishmanolysin family protein (macronuclear) [Tetrahymena thermophila SB210]|uniref:Leishmanolysin family protein n=1 Tax=Tetrahymena thermophila (strain SB210) TaxID=312017 RepID=I7M095_TETTS|nr:leishmanolysin family protein [Tetrahymena thermophila SB210]EAR86011.2 leishmanolysin family protein [Tetrahymena thermophila SB210]|eukprot:XP_976606.2 leishmanolysin family protein [Tetrahymena thermophila SB210]
MQIILKMNKSAILMLYTIFIVYAQNVNKQEAVNSCLQDEIDLSEMVPKDYLETFEEKYGNRILKSYEPQPIRITLDFYELENPLNGDGMTPSKKEYLKKIMYAAQIYLTKLIKVYPRQGPLKYIWDNENCYDIKIPQYIKKIGVENSDLHIFVTYSNLPKSQTLANAIWCQLDPQPNVGRVLFNIGAMDIDESSTQSFQDNFSTSLHEILHILGFTGKSVQYWIDPDTNKPYGENNVSKILTSETRWQIDNVLKISSKNILRVSRNHYNCPSINGMYLENQGGSGSMGSHWERDLLSNEFMTASIVQRIYSISEFTAALLLDTGYYAEINSNFLNPIYWGKNKGCDFFNNSCNTAKDLHEFPNNTQESCDFYYEGIGSLQNYDDFSQCKIIYTYRNGYCDSYQFKPDEILRQNTGKGSKCFRSNANIKGHEILDIKGRCFKAQCANDLSSIKVNVWDDEYVTCNYPNQVINLAEQTKTTQGTMRCPHDFDLFCNFPKSCPNNCSNSGVCNNGYCVCLKGYAGADCSQRCPEEYVWDSNRCVQNCPRGQFKNLDNTCKPTCPYKYYGEKFTGNCTLCSVNCSACFGSASNQCLSCNDGYSLQGNKCVEMICYSSCQSCSGPNSNQCTSCPAGKYLDSRNTCQHCQSPCENCFNSSTECTTCSQGYFMDRFSGKCVSENSCDSSCLDCSAFRDPTKCTLCRDGFFLNEYGECQKCDQSCSICTMRGNNCIKCVQGWEYSASKKRCFYNCHESCDTCTLVLDPKACIRCAFNHVMSNNQCVPCDKSCHGCTENPKKCNECAKGYYLDSYYDICVPTCRSDEFQDSKGNCQKCQQPCATCQFYSDNCITCLSGYIYDFYYKSCIPTNSFCHETCDQCSRNNDPYSCTKCKDGMYLINGECYQCSGKCQTCEKNAFQCTSCKQKQFLNNYECLQCHSSCQTCFGISTNCTSCQQGFSKDPLTGLCINNLPRCKSNEYLDKDYQCQQCELPCASCFNLPNKCQSCISGYIYNSQTFQCQQFNPVCYEGEFLDFDNKCKYCDRICATCDIYSNRCTSCKHGFTLSKNSCYEDKCQDGSFINQYGRCQKCSNSCRKCINYYDNCTECADGYSYNIRTQTCVINESYQKCHHTCKQCNQSNNAFACQSCYDCNYLSNGQCLPCKNNCQTCDRYSDFCTSCQNGFKLNRNQGRCIPECKYGEYLDQSVNLCKQCAYPCESCEFNPSQCTSCIQGYNYNSKSQSCTILCRLGEYSDRGLYCKPCSFPCETCEDYDDKCLSCVQDYTYSNYQCLKNSKTNLRYCHESCNSCIRAMDPNSCDSCKEGYILINRTCQKKKGNYFEPKN